MPVPNLTCKDKIETEDELRLILRQDSRHRISTALSLGGLHKKV
jgi:hypothetical protein